MTAFSDTWPFIRECQSCGHQQEAKDPATYANGSDKWRDMKCRKCGSEDLDYGSKRPWTEAQKKQLEDYERAEGERD